MPLVVKNPPANAGDVRDTGSIPGSSRSLGGGHSNPLQYSCLQNPIDRGGWQATDRRVAKSYTEGHVQRTKLSDLAHIAHTHGDFLLSHN